MIHTIRVEGVRNALLFLSVAGGFKLKEERFDGTVDELVKNVNSNQMYTVVSGLTKGFPADAGLVFKLGRLIYFHSSNCEDVYVKMQWNAWEDWKKLKLSAI